MEKSEMRLVNMITICAVAHPCVELAHSDNRVHRGTLFIMLFIWLHTEREAESCLNSFLLPSLTGIRILHCCAATFHQDVMSLC